MLTVLMIVSVLLIIIVLLQSEKAESGNIITGGNADLFMNRKERGGELFITRLRFRDFILYFVYNYGHVVKKGFINSLFLFYNIYIER